MSQEMNNKQVSPPLSAGEVDPELLKNFDKKVNISNSEADEFQDAQDGSSEVDSAVTDFEDSDIGTSMPPAPSFKSVLLQFLKNVATSGTDLYSMSSPAIMCNGISVLEYCAHYCDHPEILAAISKGETPLDRMLVVVQWYLSGLFGSYASRSTSSGFERKPFNPILGERFFAEWADEGYGKTEMVAEQVSHHPPTTAFYVHNETAGVHVNAFSTQKTRFMGTCIRAEQQGNVFVYLDKFKEEYMITLPEIYVRGILTGAPFVELCGDVAMVSSAGFGVKMRFIPKPWFSGEYDQVEAVIFDTKSGKIHYDIWGKWSASVYFDEHDEDSEKRCHFRKSKTASTSSESESVSSGSNTGDAYPSLVEDHTRQGPTLFNPELMPKIPFSVKPISKQTELESRRVWHPVAKALQQADYSAANDAKNKIENKQRALRKERAERNEIWQPTFFTYENFCFMPNIHKESEHLEEILSNLISDAPEVMVVESSESSSSNASSSALSSSPASSASSVVKRPKHGYKGRWVFNEFSKKRLGSFKRMLIRSLLFKCLRTPVSTRVNSLSSIQHIQHKRLFSTTENSEFEAIKKALEADTVRKDTAPADGQIKGEKRMLIGFTCKKCQHRTHRTMSHHAYHHGIVLIECSGCQSRHLIADNLGWFKDTPQAARKIEEMTEVVGEIRKNLKLNESESRGLIELLKGD